MLIPVLIVRDMAEAIAFHTGVLDQTWGTRELCIDDPNGNTIIFQQRACVCGCGEGRGVF